MANLSASKRTIVDVLAMSLDLIFKIVVPLVGDKIACLVCGKTEVNLFIMTLRDLDKHLSLHHVDARIEWGCFKCEKSFFKLHGARCHIPKYSEPPAMPVRVDLNAMLAP